MNRRQVFFLYLISLAVLLISAAMTPSPGYMDADYYFAGGLNFINRTDGREAYIWNFLSKPEALPVPAYTYWMPLPAFLAGTGMLLSGSTNYWFARLPFILLAASIAPLSGWLAFMLSKRATYAWIAGLLAAASGYYLPYLSATSTFTPTMLLGTAFITLLGKLFNQPAKLNSYITFLAIGVITGLLHMNRADGLIWFGTAVILVFVTLIRRKTELTKIILSLLLLFSGYVVISGAWYLRNLQDFGGLFPSGTNRTLWLTNYDELYFFDTSILTPARWIANGLPSILNARIQAAWQNILQAIAVQGNIFLVPSILVGIWILRKNALVRITGVIWLITFGTMSFVFPFAGMRGGYFHSSAMVQPIFWAIVPVGLVTIIKWIAEKRRWKKDRQARNVFAVASILLCLGITAAAIWIKAPKEGDVTYADAGDLMNQHSVPKNAVVLVNNPPGLFSATGHPAVAIPAGGSEVALRAAQRYQAQYLLLDPKNNAYLKDLYSDPDGTASFEFLGGEGEIKLYKIKL